MPVFRTCLSSLSAVSVLLAAPLPGSPDPGKASHRPWIQGLGLHLEQEGAWRLQVMAAPALLPRAPSSESWPDAFRRLPAPSVMVHMKELRAGLRRLSELAGGREGALLRTAAQGSRAGFLLRHVDRWLAQAEPALEPLGGREAWVLHYGQRIALDPKSGMSGTAVFIPGDLPARTQLAMAFLRLNPFSTGLRSRRGQVEIPGQGAQPIEQLRGSGGVLYMAFRPEGTWLADREAALRTALGGGGPRLLQASPEWGRLAMAGRRPSTQVSFWILPRLGGDPDFEKAMGALRKEAPRKGGPATLLLAAPRSGAATLALGSGPVAAMFRALVEPDELFQVPEPKLPAFATLEAMSPQQKRDYQLSVQAAKNRAKAQAALKADLARLVALLDPASATLHWQGWTQAPPLSAEEEARMRSFRATGRWKDAAGKERRENPAGEFYGGYGDPGLTPSLAVALPVKAGRSAEAELQLKQVFPRLFKGQGQTKPLGAVQLHRYRTAQAFAPTWALAKDTLVLGSDDGAVAAVVAGLLGQGPTLADLPRSSWGLAELDGERFARGIEGLLQGYLGAQGNPRQWWMRRVSDIETADEAAAEVASTFGPVLGLIRQQGRRSLSLDWTPAGFEVKPR